MSDAPLSIADGLPTSDINDLKAPQYEGSSIRWKHFSTSYGLAAKKISMGWSYEEFAQCIPGWSAAQPVQANDVCKQISDYVQDTIIGHGETIFEKYRAAEGIDMLHQVIAEARTKKEAGDVTGKDIWTKVIDPKTAIRARIVPVLEEEKARLAAALDKIQAENDHLAGMLRESQLRRTQQDAMASEWLDALEEVASKFAAIPSGEIMQWSIETQESGV